MKSIIDNLMRDIPANVETIVFPKDAYFQLLAEINALQDRIKFSTGTIKVAEHKIEEQAARIAQLTQWLESAENACHEKDDEIARLKPAANTREEKAREQRMAAMGCKAIYARNAKGDKLAAVDVPIPPTERIKALCAEASRLETALDLEHNRYLEARREIARLNERLKESNNFLLDARQALTELNQAYERVRTTTQQLVKQKTELEKQLNELKSADNRPTQDRVARPSRVEQLETEVTLLKQEKASLRDELVKTRQDRDYWISLVRSVYNTTAVVAEHK